MNNEKKKSKNIDMSKFTEEKTVIIKSGNLNKRSKYLKLWKKYNIHLHRRFIILTNKNMFSFTSEDKTADCTMNLDIKDCKKVENSDQQLSKNNTFCIIQQERNYYFQANSEVEKYEWINALKKVITNPGVINEQDELDYANNPDRTVSFISVEK